MPVYGVFYIVHDGTTVYYLDIDYYTYVLIYVLFNRNADLDRLGVR